MKNNTKATKKMLPSIDDADLEHVSGGNLFDGAGMQQWWSTTNVNPGNWGSNLSSTFSGWGGGGGTAENNGFGSAVGNSSSFGGGDAGWGGDSGFGGGSSGSFGGGDLGGGGGWSD